MLEKSDCVRGSAVGVCRASTLEYDLCELKLSLAKKLPHVRPQRALNGQISVIV
jgi:hypothetical protein